MSSPYRSPEFLGKQKESFPHGKDSFAVTLAQLAGYLASVRAAPTATVRCLAFFDSATGRAMVKTPFS